MGNDELDVCVQWGPHTLNVSALDENCLVVEATQPTTVSTLILIGVIVRGFELPTKNKELCVDTVVAMQSGGAEQLP